MSVHVPKGASTCCTLGDGHTLTDTEWRVIQPGDDTEATRDASGSLPSGSKPDFQVKLHGVWIDVPPLAHINPKECGVEPDPKTRHLAKVWFGPMWMNGPTEKQVMDGAYIYCFTLGIME